ncbi:hypothetical protein NEOKW01_0645 [Nematocida sp. AWRm80]|nr:hypothetical protein NEOKW01_0645 [Nematocida sp. AWRm80]
MESSECPLSSNALEKEAPSIERVLSVRMVYNYTEKTILLSGEEDIIQSIKQQAEKLFSLSHVRLEIDKKPLTLAEQLFSTPNPKVFVIGIKNKCALEECKNIAHSLAMALCCKFCKKSFCQRHFIPEEHVCENISVCKEEAAQDNLKRLLNKQVPRR